MGTNYFAVKKKPRIVEIYDKFHIGKSSVGWKFYFQSQKEYKNFDEFKNWLLTQKDYIIKDEYDREITPKELMEIIEDKQEINNPNDFSYNAENIDGYRFTNEEFR